MSKLILGDGLLGSELIKQTNWDYISRKKDDIDFTDSRTYKHFLLEYDVIINCIANTDTYSEDREKHWDINYKAVADLVDICNDHNKKIVHISTDYLYTHSKENASEEDVPVHCGNWYGYTKLLADGYVQLKSNNFLLIRSTHKSEPFPYDKAWINQIGNFDYTSVITELIIKLINNNAVGVYNVGTELKTMFDLAKKTKKDVVSVINKNHHTTPDNVSMNLEKLGKVNDIF